MQRKITSPKVRIPTIVWNNKEIPQISSKFGSFRSNSIPYIVDMFLSEDFTCSLHLTNITLESDETFQVT